MNTFKVNGKEYKAKQFDFNMICDLEEMGIPIEKIRDKPLSAIRAYFAICSESSPEIAGKEIESHVIAGGKIDGISAAFYSEIEKSDFFQKISKGEETENSASKETEAAAEGQEG